MAAQSSRVVGRAVKPRGALALGLEFYRARERGRATRGREAAAPAAAGDGGRDFRGEMGAGRPGKRGGILLGPSALGRSHKFLHAVFPPQSMTVLDTLANLGLLFFLFLVGLELDISAIRRTGKKALAIALAGISAPFALGIGTSFAFRATIVKGAPQGPFLVFMGVALSITAFPVLARILAELKLLTTDLGRMSMSAAAVNDVAAWILLALAIALSGSGSPIIALWVLLTAAGFVIAISLFLRPVLAWMARRSPEGEPVKEVYICATLAIVLAAGFVTDTIGIHALFGAFMVGIVVPKDGPFAGLLIEKVEDLISGLFLPLYFVSSGLKTDVATIKGAKSWGLLVLVIANACLGKIGGTVITSLFVKIPVREAVTLGFLMNTKGLVELIVLNIGRDRKVLNDEAFAILVLMALFTTFITTPIVMAIYKPARMTVPYKRRTVECSPGDADGELRVQACFHTNRHIPTLLNLVEASRGTGRRRLTMYAMHLVELSERSSAISLVQRARRDGMPFFNSKEQRTEQVVVAFEAFQQLSSVRVRPMTAISDLDTIHRDVIDSAADKRAAIIIMPYHKALHHDGSFQSLGSPYHAINKRVLREAPCSVAILVDRGLGGHAQVSAKNVSFSVAALFFGGPDDREALAYATRMAEHPGVAVTLARFQPSRLQSGEEDAADEAAVEAFKAKVGAVKDGSVRFEEPEAYTREQVLETIESLSGFNVFVVGRMPPTSPLVERPDELGPVGSYLVSPGFRTSASVLVVKRYDPATNPKSKRFDPKARPPAATELDALDEEMGSAAVVPVTQTPMSEIA
ncbi:cation/H(+) antiporter 19-like [Panicum miliaceum]|uniref:Cation/H(+) antiporter 19-like n=1 Tax=Panicum miliaceum TaxID=4540 RepID=A0A3L6SYS1_PANMI|nr:cation/H(+) antiporter 19-like [Panicum miliaceum]